MARPQSTGPQTREAILDVALELFSTKGYDATSLRDIAERLSISKAALYYYFAHKQDILVELHMRMHAWVIEFMDEIEQIPDGTERYAAWPELVQRFRATINENRDLLFLHISNEAAIESMQLDGRNRAANAEMYERLVAVFTSPALTLEQRMRMLTAIAAAGVSLRVADRLFQQDSDADLEAALRPIIKDILNVGSEAPSSAQPPADPRP